MTLIAAALLCLTVWLATNGSNASANRRRGIQFGLAVVVVALANVAVLTRANESHDTVALLLSLATSATLVGALHFWAASLRVRQHPRTTPKRRPHR